MHRFDPNLTLRFSLQRALIGEITPPMLAVTAGLRGTGIVLTAYLDQPATADDVDRLSAIGAEVIADFPAPYTISEQCRWVGEADPQPLDFWAFKRAEEPATIG